MHAPRLDALPTERARADGPRAGPDFFCVGAQKGGTRWLYDQLQHHEDFWMPPIKELHYFDRRRPSPRAAKFLRRADTSLTRFNRRRGKRNMRALVQRDLDFLKAYIELPWHRFDLETYAGLFGAKGGSIAGDITPDYCVLRPEIIARVVSRFPDAKVVFIARDPVERVWSQLTMHMRKGDLARNLGDAEIMRVVDKRFVARRTYQTDIVARWRRYVPDSQFTLYLFDDLMADPVELRRRILTFLDADPAKPSGAVSPGFNRKRDPEKMPLSLELKQKLGRHLGAELRASAEAFGGAAEGWPDRYGL
ncbi:MAG: sulfotransferase [Hyphomicrobiales bacterium]|nr:sulfotransferase [Hyphomicrobiales bacterium]